MTEQQKNERIVYLFFNKKYTIEEISYILILPIQNIMNVLRLEIEQLTKISKNLTIEKEFFKQLKAINNFIKEKEGLQDVLQPIKRKRCQHIYKNLKQCAVFAKPNEDYCYYHKIIK